MVGQGSGPVPTLLPSVLISVLLSSQLLHHFQLDSSLSFLSKAVLLVLVVDHLTILEDTAYLCHGLLSLFPDTPLTLFLERYLHCLDGLLYKFRDTAH